MEVSSEEDELIVLLGCSVVLLQLRKRNRRKKRTIWVNPYLLQRRVKGRFASDDMRNNPSIFKENFHVRPDQFDFLVSCVGVGLSAKAQTRPKDGITPVEKLAMTLEYLASGSLQRHIASCYRVSKQRIGPIIEETCFEIVRTLQGEMMSNLNQEKWIEVSNTYHSLWNFPNCVGAVDGKHVSIKCPQNGGSAFFNHKGLHSIVLMAIADADCKFLYYDIGGYGSEGDSNIFKTCQFGKSLLQDLQIL